VALRHVVLIPTDENSAARALQSVARGVDGQAAYRPLIGRVDLRACINAVLGLTGAVGLEAR
jgi:hypothetical protein